MELIDDVPEDTLEDILYTAADGLVRCGDTPDEILRIMEQNGCGSAYLIKGQAAFYLRPRNYKDAEDNLKKALGRNAYRTKTSRLLAKVYLLTGRPAEGLEVLNKLGEPRIRRDGGLLSLKITFLRAARRRREADELEGTLRMLKDEYGEYDLLQAARAICRRIGQRPGKQLPMPG